MKLDPRIIDGKKPLDCFDAEKAEKFVGQRGSERKTGMLKLL